jgi:glutamine cyclotransferase
MTTRARLASAVLLVLALTPLAGRSAFQPSGKGTAGSAAPKAAAARKTVAAYSYDVVRTFSRGRDAYTQGFVFYRGRLFEGTGQYGQSRLLESVLADGQQKIVRQRPLPDDLPLSATQRRYQSDGLSDRGYPASEIAARQKSAVLFGEGIAIKNGLVYQLTWMEGVCLVWDISNWNSPAKTFRYAGEGWGLTHDGTHLIMSDGSSTLFFRDPATFEVVRKVHVVDPRSGSPVPQLNELEFIDGKVYANIYHSRVIAIIDPKSGSVEGYVFFDGQQMPGSSLPTLLPRATWQQLDDRGEVLNGIAYDPESRHLFITGKYWPAIYEITLRKVRDSF